MEGFIYRGNKENFYYDVKDKILFSYDRYKNGEEGHFYKEYEIDIEISYEDFILKCKSFED